MGKNDSKIEELQPHYKAVLRFALYIYYVKSGFKYWLKVIVTAELNFVV